MTSQKPTDSTPTGVLVLSTQSGIAGVDGPSAGETDRSFLSPCSPCSGKSSSTLLASSLPALRNDSGVAAWRLTEKAIAYLWSFPNLRGQEVARSLLPLVRCSGECDSAGTAEASSCV